MHVIKQNNHSFIKKYFLDIGTLELYDDYVVGELKEGITIDLESASKLKIIANKHFSTDKPFTYISIRNNSYAVDPTVYLKIKMENLKAIAIVSNKPNDIHNFKIEKHFFKKPMELFNSLPEAIIWTKQHI